MDEMFIRNLKKNYYDVICANIFLTELKELVKDFCFVKIMDI